MSEISAEQITKELQDMGVDVETGTFKEPESVKVINEEVSEDVNTEELDTEEVIKEEVVSEKEITDSNKSKDLLDKDLVSVEKEATEKGWKPDGPKSAEEFLRAEPLYDEIKARGKEIKELKKTLDEMKAFMDKQQELGYKKALEELKGQRKDAIIQGDIDLVDKLDSEIKSHESNIEPVKDNDYYANEFLDKYKSKMESDDLFEAYVMKKDQELAQDNLSPKMHFKLLEMEIKQKFNLDKKAEPEIEKVIAPTVESNTYINSKPKSKEPNFANMKSKMNKFQLDNAYAFEKKGIMKKDDYVKALIAQGDIK